MTRTFMLTMLTALTLALTACGEDGDPDVPVITTPAGTATQPAIDGKQFPPTTEGSVTTKEGSFVTYSDGAKVSIVKVEVRDAVSDGLWQAQVGDHSVRVTQRIENTGTGDMPLNTTGTWSVKADLAYGENWTVATPHAGSDPYVELPGRLTPGTHADWTTTSLVPAGQLGVLRFTVNPNTTTYSDYTFTDVEELLAP